MVLISLHTDLRDILLMDFDFTQKKRRKVEQVKNLEFFRMQTQLAMLVLEIGTLALVMLHSMGS